MSVGVFYFKPPCRPSVCRSGQWACSSSG